MTELSKLLVGGDDFTANGTFISKTEGSTTPLHAYKANEGTGGAAFGQWRSRGTLEIPTALQDGDVVGGFSGLAHDGTSYGFTAAIRYKVDGAVSTGVTPQKMTFETGETNSPLERLVIKPNGDIYFNDDTQTAGMIWDASANTLSLGGVIENTYDLVGTEIDPSNGTMQYKTTTSATTFTISNIQVGQSIVITTSAAPSVTFTGATWITSDGNAPTIIGTNDTFVVWKDLSNTIKVSYLGGSL